MGTNHGTGNQIDYGLGQHGQAFVFSGDNWVDAAAPPAVPKKGSWTYVVWLAVSSWSEVGLLTDGFGTYFIDRVSASLPLVDLKAVGDKLAFQVRYDDGSGLGGVLGPAIEKDAFTHVAMVRDAGKFFFLYVDGRLAGQIADTGASLTPDAFRLGHHAEFPDSGFEGAIDDLEIYDQALSPAQIAALAARGGD